MADNSEIRPNPDAFEEMKRETEKALKPFEDAMNEVLAQIGDTPENRQRLTARLAEMNSGPLNKEWEREQQKAFDGKADVAAIRRLLNIG